jgi:hypothetical protein
VVPWKKIVITDEKTYFISSIKLQTTTPGFNYPGVIIYIVLFYSNMLTVGVIHIAEGGTTTKN